MFFRLRSKPKFRGGGRRSGWCSSRVSCRRGIFLRRLLLVLLVVVVGLDCFSIAVKLWRVIFFGLWLRKIEDRDGRGGRRAGAKCTGESTLFLRGIQRGGDLGAVVSPQNL